MHNIFSNLGNPPNRTTNNLVESMNNVIKEQINHQSLDLLTFLEKMKENVFDYQTNQMVLAIRKMGEYRLTEQYESYSIDPITWATMTSEQQKQHVSKILLSDVSHCFQEDSTHTMSVHLDQVYSKIDVSQYVLNGIWKSAALIVANNDVIFLAGGNVAVKDFDRFYNVLGKKHQCECSQYRETGGLCKHNVAAAEIKGFLLDLIEVHSNKKNRLGRVIANTKPVTGIKPKNAKQRKGKNNILAAPITALIKNDTGTNAYDADLDKQPEQLFTEIWHNNELFFVTKTDDKRFKIKKCVSCFMEFPKSNPAAGRGDLVIRHKERYLYPVKDTKGKTKMTPTRIKMVDKFLCISKNCIKNRYPYFWKGLLSIENEVKQMLVVEHFDVLLQELHFKC